ncbi:MAG: POTRA domain-containing protein [Deltaproteobacteria bacterium]
MMLAFAWGVGSPARAEDGLAQAPPAPAARAQPRTLDILEFRVEGSTVLSADDLERALYPFLGPGRVLEDVEKARVALDKAYSDKGFLSVVVAIPPQTVRGGVVTLQVTEGKVGQLRVRGATYFLPSEVKKHAPSVAEGKVPNVNDLVRDIVVLNQFPDRRVAPAVRAGVEPGTVDVDLNVQDTLPLHGSLELNNRYSAGTTPLRINGSIRYDNLWQAGHSIGFAFQLAPQRIADGEVFSATYRARIPGVTWLSFSASATFQDSEVSTLGSSAATGKGRIYGLRALFTLPGSTGFYQSLAVGADYKNFYEGLSFSAAPGSGGGTVLQQVPVSYWPFTVSYGGTWAGETSQTQVNATLVANLRGLSSSAPDFDAKRYKASGNFVYLRADASRTDSLFGGMQLSEKVQAMYCQGPLISSEQFVAGGIDSVRGYLEVTASGDYGVVGTFEVRSPPLLGWTGNPGLQDWRVHLFTDVGWTAIHDALPEQWPNAGLWSVGAGTRARLFGHLGGDVEFGLPLRAQGTTEKMQPRIQFRVWGDF